MADVVKEYLKRINAIEGLSVSQRGGKAHLQAKWDSDPKVALKQIRAMETQLRAIKKEATATEAVVRQKYQEAAAKTTYRPGLGGALLGAKFRGSMQSAGAEQKRKLTEAKNKDLLPFEEIKNLIDQILAQLDVKKAGHQSLRRLR